MFVDDARQAQLFAAQQLAGERRVEQVVDLKMEIAFEPGDVIGGRMHDFFDGGVGQQRSQPTQIANSEGVHDVVLGCGGNLDQADVFVIGVVAVGFGVDG